MQLPAAALKNCHIHAPKIPPDALFEVAEIICPPIQGVGMNRWDNAREAEKRGVPHRRGDEPTPVTYSGHDPLCSPQAWG